MKIKPAPAAIVTFRSSAKNSRLGPGQQFGPELRMAAGKPRPKKHTVYRKDGSVWARSQMLNGIPVGYWEWFRKEGTRMRSGSLDEAGAQIGAWTTYDKSGDVYKVTDMNRQRKPRDKS